ncbi:putative ATP-dependent DNA ligase [Pseudomonas phage LKD16]|uniref:DNA ligase n=1 Tax=Pseudomonas phage LKD16 TaxID=386792 RepID=Q0E648_9CAUD|nr:DNA ligase [Pseudomonas phage LKD16]CAK25951.1 putative ATP-dependent DNA ligase [Pseudomonas phage LKD16]
MSTKRDVILDIEKGIWRGVDNNPAAIEKVLKKNGFVLVEPKIDGCRAIVGAHGVVSRSGRAFPALTGLDDRIANHLNHHVTQAGIVLDCEMYLCGMSFEDSCGRLQSKEPLSASEYALLRFAVFDSTHVEVLLRQRKSHMSNAERRALAGTAMDCVDSLFFLVNNRVVSNMADLEHVYHQYRSMGFEGAMVKDPSLPYRNGKVSGCWKMKPSLAVEGIVVGFVMGKTGANVGKVVGYRVDLEDGTGIVSATGLTRDRIEMLTTEAELLGGADHPGMADLGRVVEVTAMERSANTLRHPKFSRFRDILPYKGVKV